MKLKNKKVLVTGGAGFIGSHIVDMLVNLDAKVTVIDNLSAGRLSNLNKSIKKINFKKIDILEAKKVTRIINGQDIVIHLAANADVPFSVKYPDHDFNVNIIGSYNVIKACKEANIKKLVFASSAAVYGNPVYIPIDEKHPTNPVSPYGASKLAIEKLGQAYQKTYGFPFVTMRIFNTYGERQPRYVMYDLLKKLYKDAKNLVVLGTGDQIRDYSYVTDTAKAFILAVQVGEPGEIYNIAGGRPVSIKEVVGYLLKTLGIEDIKINYTMQSWKGDITTLIANINKISSRLNFKPDVKIEKGVSLLHEYLLKRYE